MKRLATLVGSLLNLRGDRDADIHTGKNGNARVLGIDRIRNHSCIHRSAVERLPVKSLWLRNNLDADAGLGSAFASQREA